MAMELKTEAQPRRDQPVDDQPDVSGDDVLELLGDPYTRCVLNAVLDARKSGSDIVAETDVSKATVYRRLEELRDAGIVESQTVFDPDGHHHEEFEAAVDGISVDFEGGDFSATFETHH